MVRWVTAEEASSNATTCPAPGWEGAATAPVLTAQRATNYCARCASPWMHATDGIINRDLSAPQAWDLTDDAAEG